MKKTYIEPSITLVELKMESMIAAGSVGSTSEEEAGSGSEDAPVNFSRQGWGSVWDDDADEE